MTSSEFAPNHDAALAEIGGAERYNEWMLSRARPYLGDDVIDAGAGIGTFVELLAREVETVAALEPHPPFAQLLRERFRGHAGVRVVEADAATAARDRLVEAADSIVCFNVLEHIPDDASALAAFHQLLRPGGHVLLLVPAHPQLYGAADAAFGHVRRYRLRPLRALLERCGFDVVTAKYVNPVGALGWLVSMRLLRRPKASPAAVKAFDLLVPLLRPLDRLTLPVGQSVWAVARRRDEPRDEM